jgi:hypothetical protein
MFTRSRAEVGVHGFPVGGRMRSLVTGRGQLQDLQGPSYLFAILTDDRIAPPLRALQAHKAQGTPASGPVSLNARSRTRAG